MGNKKNEVEKVLHVPSVAVAPGETLMEVLESVSMSQTELAQRMGRPLKLINEIVKGKASITPETAIQLERVLGIEAAFWIKLESIFQEVKARKAADEHLLGEELELAKQYPYEDMVSNGWIEKTSNQLTKVKNLLNYFAVNSFKNILEERTLEPMLYRISQKKKVNPAAVSAWLRKGVIDSQDINTDTYSEEKLRQVAKEIRALTLEANPNIFLEKIKTLLASAGVCFVITRSLPNVPVNGVSRWLNGDRPLIQLSIYGKFADKFWFSLFHEIGHVLLHGKKPLNIDISGNPIDVKEAEANEYAQNILIPKEEYINFLTANSFDGGDILNFSKKISLHAGIIVGRLQLEQKIGFNRLNHLRTKYEWVDKK